MKTPIKTKRSSEKVQKQIEEILDVLRTHEVYDNYFMDEELNTLRHFILFTHARIEYSLETYISNYLFIKYKNFKHKNNEKPSELFDDYFRVILIIQDMDFWKKVTKVQEIEKRTGEVIFIKGMLDKLRKLNQYRIWFSHSTAHLREIRSLQNQHKQLEVYRMLQDILESLDVGIPFKQTLQEWDKRLYFTKNLSNERKLGVKGTNKTGGGQRFIKSKKYKHPLEYFGIDPETGKRILKSEDIKS